MNVKRILSSCRFVCVPIVALVAVVLLPLFNTKAAVAADIPKTDHDAATMEYQIKELDRLLPSVDVSKVPPGFDQVVWEAFIPEDNAMTPERVALGRKLYFDKRLSADGTVSCATCHDVTRGFTDQLAVSEGIKDQLGRRNAPTTLNVALFNAPTTLNVALLQTIFFDGRSPTLEHQAKQPILNPIEMGMPDGQAAVDAIKDDAEYQAAFKKAYGRKVNYEDVGRAIAAFERTLVFVDSSFRRFLNGDEDAISSEAKLGWELYNEKGRCVTCHPINPSNPGDRQPLSQCRSFGPAPGFRGPCEAGPEGNGGGRLGAEAR
ncbi:MAG: cytochrome-c peroxidase [Planctomycetota bacterium]